jgi:predicted AlkP superfamily phosphohydrolase/phosphomutase
MPARRSRSAGVQHGPKCFPALRGAQTGRSPARSEGERPRDPAKRETLKRLGALGLLALVDAGALASCGPRVLSPTARERKVIVLGLDGLDPQIVDRMMAAGKLQHMRRLRAISRLRNLTSSIPPQSPVAWATFITGRDPGGHRIYDFVHRDPETYELVNAIARTSPPAVRLPFGQWRVPLSSSRAELLRAGTAFWDILAERGIPCEVYRVPANFPPRDTGVKQLAGLGTPDLRGTNGTCAYYTDAPTTSPAAREYVHRLRLRNGRAKGRLIGPRNSLRSSMPDTWLDFDLSIDRDHALAKISIQGRELLLRVGEWSDWVPVKFAMVPGVKTVSGILRFYLKQASPHFGLYAGPINFDPMDAALPIAAPPGFAREMAERFGRFHTLGFPQDTNALDAEILDDGEYLHQSGMIVDEARRIYHSALNQFQRGLLFYYFSTSDRTQHMFWRTMDPQHPAHDARSARDYGSAIEDCYQTCDGIVGDALEACDSDTTLVVLSDHGFAPLYRKFNLNTWLAAHGYLALRSRAKTTNKLSEDADWSNTTAYALGLNSVYINVRGREARGTVAEEDRQRVAQALARELRKVRDPIGGERVFENVYLADEVYSGARGPETPDLIAGYARGYRCSSASGLGKIAPQAIEDNEGKWSGDHCIDRTVVPGILLANKPIRAQRPALPDVTAGVLAEFGLRAPDDMQGNSIW